MRSFAYWAVAVTAAVALTSVSSLAAVEVAGYRASFVWSPSTGPVESYLVEVSRNRGAFKAEWTVSAPEVRVSGRLDEKLNIRVFALGASGNRSAPSPVSDTIEFVGPDGADDGGGGADDDEGGADDDEGGADDGWNGEDGGSQSRPAPPVRLARGAMPYDFDGDGRTDLLYHNPEAGIVGIGLMRGTSHPLFAVLGALEEPWSPVGSGDFDGDGYADLLLREPLQGRSEIWLIDEGGVRSAASFEGPRKSWRVEAIGDFDGEGYSDMLWRKRVKSRIWFMRGRRVDEEVSGPSFKKGFRVVCALELDGDGRSDLIWSGSQETVAGLMDGPSPWRSGPAGPLMEESLTIGCGDADGDGFGDVLWYHPESRRGILWVMDGDIGMDRSLDLPPLPKGWTMEASGDFDGDGLANDILVREASSGTIGVWTLEWNHARSGFRIVSVEIAARLPRDWNVIAP
jgi:hypothetical protein